MTRDEHLAWAKSRALEYANQGDAINAMASMTSDLRKHPELERHAGIELGMTLMMTGNLSIQHDAVKFIEGFN